MYVIYRRKGFQDYPVTCFRHESDARESFERFRQMTGEYFLSEEADDSPAVQKLQGDLFKKIQ